jgi:hypothetical protein
MVPPSVPCATAGTSTGAASVSQSQPKSSRSQKPKVNHLFSSSYFVAHIIPSVCNLSVLWRDIGESCLIPPKLEAGWSVIPVPPWARQNPTNVSKHELLDDWAQESFESCRPQDISSLWAPRSQVKGKTNPNTGGDDGCKRSKTNIMSSRSCGWRGNGQSEDDGAKRVCLSYCVDLVLNECQEPYNRERHEQLIAEWIAACDQPFDEVEKEEFRRMISYGSRQGSSLHIPSADSIKRRIMQMGDNTVSDLKAMIAVCIQAILWSVEFTVRLC